MCTTKKRIRDGKAELIHRNPDGSVCVATVAKDGRGHLVLQLQTPTGSQDVGKIRLTDASESLE